MEVDGGDDIPDEDPWDDAENFVGSMEDLSEEAYLPPKLIEEEAIRVAMILSKEEEKRRWAGNDINLADMPPQQARDKHHDNLPAPSPRFGFFICSILILMHYICKKYYI
jgi:hypothetical protein